ncbi:MAG: hypothetical protein ACQEXX_01360 [Bacillota bacterium]
MRNTVGLLEQIEIYNSIEFISAEQIKMIIQLTDMKLQKRVNGVYIFNDNEEFLGFMKNKGFPWHVRYSKKKRLKTNEDVLFFGGFNPHKKLIYLAIDEKLKPSDYLDGLDVIGSYFMSLWITFTILHELKHVDQYNNKKFYSGNIMYDLFFYLKYKFSYKNSNIELEADEYAKETMLSYRSEICKILKLNSEDADTYKAVLDTINNIR